MATLKPDRSAFDKALSRAAANAGKKYATAFREAIEAEVYEWPRDTKRRSGRVVGSPRDIVDTGRLRDSQRWNQTQVGVLTYSWTANYALQVLLGYTTSFGLERPGRDWIRYAQKENDFAKIAQDECRKVF